MLSNLVLEKTFESPLDSKVIKPVNPTGNQLQIFIGRIDAEAPTFWSPELKSLLTLMLGKIEGRSRRGWQRMAWWDGITNLKDMSLSKLWEIVNDRDAWRPTVHGVAGSQTWLSNWTTTNMTHYLIYGTEADSQTQRHRETTCGCQEGMREGCIGSWGLIEANYYV